MSAPVQSPVVKIQATHAYATLRQAQSAPRPATPATTGARLLGFLMSALGAWAV